MVQVGSFGPCYPAPFANCMLREMEKEQDVDVAIPMITKVQKHFDNVHSASFDRGYYSPSNQEELNSLVTKLILPKKGKLSKKIWWKYV